MNALVVGAAGQLGSAMTARLAGADGAERCRVIPLTRRDVDLRDSRGLDRFVRQAAPDVIINCAAYVNVDGAEDDPMAALDVNAIAVRTLAGAASALGARLVHFSTDFVFDGLASHPYEETDPPSPQSVYGTSKLLGEFFARHLPTDAYVLRVESLFGGPKGASSIDKIIQAIDRGAEARVFVDRVVTPSYIEDVVTATLRLLDLRAPAGVYHCVNSGETTWYELGKAIAAHMGVDARLVPVNVADVVLRARRPKYCALSNQKLAQAGILMPSWQDALERYLRIRPRS